MKDFLKQTIIKNSQTILSKGLDIEPMFLGATKHQLSVVTSFAPYFGTEQGKDHAVTLGRTLVREHKLTQTALVFEGWLSTFTRKQKNEVSSQDTPRDEALVITIESSSEIEVITIPIRKRKLVVSEAETLNKIETRFRFFVPNVPTPLAA